MGVRPFLEGAAASAQVEPALGPVGRADEDFGVPVAVEVPRLDDASEVGRGAEDLGVPLPEGPGGPAVQEGAVGLGLAGLGVVAPVGEQEVDAAVPVEVGKFDLVGPLGRGGENGGGGFVPEIRRRRLPSDIFQ